MRPAAAALLLASACRFDSTLPTGVQVSCASDLVCPTGYRCQQQLWRCVQADQLDQTPPALAAGSVQVRYLPGRDNPVAQPAALAAQSTVRLAFSASEALSALPALSSSPQLDCAVLSATDVAFEFSCTVPAGLALAELQVPVEVRLVDLALNTSHLALATLAIDTLPPAAPDTSSAGAIVYRREPWGSHASAGQPRYTLRGAGGAAPGASFLLTRSGAIDRGRVAVDADAGFAATALQPVDLAELQVAAVDPAGNASAFVPVHDEEWVATASGKVAGSQIENPNRVLSVRALGDGLERLDALEHGASSGLGLIDGRALAVVGSGSWRSSGFVSPQPLEYPPTFAFDLSRAKWVGFGGSIQQVLPEHVLEWDGARWQRVDPVDPEGDGSPAGRLLAALAWDERAGRVLLYGGLTNYRPSAELWEWNGRSFVRQSDGPVARSSATLFADRRRDQLVLHGGLDELLEARDDTWVRRAGAWQRLDAGGPAGRALPLALWDEVRGRGYLGLGLHSDGGSAHDLWEFDGERWSRLPVDVPDDPRVPLAAIDRRRGRTVFWQGLQRDGGYLPALDELDEQGRWHRVAVPPDAGLPAPFIAHGLGYDPARGVTVVTGFDSTFTSQTWTWDGARLARRAVQAGPPPATDRELACVPKALACLTVAPTTSGPNDTWVLYEQGWVPAGVPPPPLGDSVALALDHGRDTLVLVTGVADGSQLLDTHVLQLGAGAWAYAGKAPFAAYDRALGAASSFRGAFFSNGAAGPTWLFADGGWSSGPLLPEPIAVLTATAMADGRLALTGIAQPSNVDAVWVEDAGSFSAIATLPPVLSRALSFDPVQHKLVLFGGLGLGTSTTDRAFEISLDGGIEELVPADPEGDGNPSARVVRSFAWREWSRSFVLSGGLTHLGQASAESDLWQLEREAHRPAVVFRVPLAAAHRPGRATLARLRAHVVAGGSGFGPVGEKSGVSLLHWGLGAWHERLASAAAFDAPADLAFDVDQPADLYALVEGRTEVAVAVTTAGANGPDRARLAVDYLEVELSWRQ